MTMVSIKSVSRERIRQIRYDAIHASEYSTGYLDSQRRNIAENELKRRGEEL